VGPVLNRRQYESILRYIESGKTQGARVVTGGGRSAKFERGYFTEPTVFADVTPDMKIAIEEIFGPVVTVLGYDNVDEAVAVANDSDLGLSGSVYGADPERAFQVATKIRSGHPCVNGFEISPAVPFGGCKNSGVGREGGPEGLEAFLETKAVFMPSHV
jgi:aldehyde dehydrogenase (NAD+)